MAINDYVRCPRCGNALYVRSNGACSYCKELLPGETPSGVGGGPPREPLAYGFKAIHAPKRIIAIDPANDACGHFAVTDEDGNTIVSCSRKNPAAGEDWPPGHALPDFDYFTPLKELNVPLLPPDRQHTTIEDYLL